MRDYEAYEALVEQTAEELNREWQKRKNENPHEHPSHLVAELLEGANRKLEGFGVEEILDEENDDIQYVNMGDPYNLTVLYDGSKDRFCASTWGDMVERTRHGYEREWLSLQQEAQKGFAVYIGEDQYYVRSINKFLANLYKMSDLEALPEEIDGKPMDWDVYKDSFSLESDIRRYKLPVTDYFLDVEDFKEAVTGNTRNTDLIRKMGLEPPEKDAPVIPVLQTNGSPYYTVGDKPYLYGAQQVEIKAMANGRVWYEEIADKNNSQPMTVDWRNFEDVFFRNPLNSDAVQRGKKIEKSGKSQVVSSINLPALVDRLNHENEDRDAWEKANPGKTVQGWLDEIAKEVECESCGPAGEPPKGTDLWRINLKGRDESLFYDHIDHKFMSGKTWDVIRQKEQEHEGYLERLNSLAERLNDKLPGFKNSDAPNMRHYVMDLLADANKEIRGDGIFSAIDSEQGVFIRYVDKCGNPSIPTILYDGNEGKFLTGSLDTLEKKQRDEYKLHLSEKEERAKFENKATRLNARLEREDMSDEDRDWFVYTVLAKNTMRMGGVELGGLYQKEKGLVIEHADIGERHAFTLMYDRESQKFLVGDPYELLEEKNRVLSESKQEKTPDIEIGQRVTFKPHDGKAALTGTVKEIDEREIVLQCGRVTVPAPREKGTFTETPEPEKTTTKAYAKEQALKHVGEQGNVFTAKGEGATYKGIVIELTPTYAIQKVGEDAILHRLKDLESCKDMIHEGAEISIVKGAKGVVTATPWNTEQEEHSHKQNREREGAMR